MVPKCKHHRVVVSENVSANKYLEQGSTSTTWQAVETVVPTLPEEDPLSCVLHKKKTGHPAPFSKKPTPTGLASFNGPPKECLPLRVLSPPPTAEHRGKRRGLHSSLLCPLSGCVLDWLVCCLGPQADSGSRSAEVVGFPTADLESAGSEGTTGSYFHYLTSQNTHRHRLTEPNEQNISSLSVYMKYRPHLGFCVLSSRNSVCWVHGCTRRVSWCILISCLGTYE